MKEVMVDDTSKKRDADEETEREKYEEQDKTMLCSREGDEGGGEAERGGCEGDGGLRFATHVVTDVMGSTMEEWVAAAGKTR